MDVARKVLPWLVMPAAIACIVGGLAPPLAALLLGAACSLVVGTPAFADMVARHLLSVSIVALGFGVNFGAVVSAGRDGLITTALTLFLTFGCGAALARWIGLRKDLALLVTAGTAICGGSAIAALAPLLRARSADVTAAIGVVFFLNAVALFVFPIVGTYCGLDAESFGQWCALAIHDTSSVLGAAATHGPEALKVATVTKLTRALWIIPIGAVVASSRRRMTNDDRKALPKIPWFLAGFVIAAVLVTLLPALAPHGERIAQCAPMGMKLSLFGIGLGLSVTTLKQVAGRAMSFGFILWLLLAAASLGRVSLEMAART